MQIPIIKGIYTTEQGEFRTRVPRNMVPVALSTGISSGYLQVAEGIEEKSTGPGICRGAICWNGTHYRVMGSKLVSVDSEGVISEIGDVTTDALPVSMDYSFDYLGIVSANRAYLFDGTTLTRVTDPDLGNVFDGIWIDGFFMYVDDEFAIVSELSNPFSVLATKYGSSDVDPDPIVAIKKVHNEVHLINRYSIEAFDNIRGSGFPFARIDGSQISRGSVGRKSCEVFADAIAFVGSGRNEQISVWLGLNGSSTKIASLELDKELSKLSDEQLSLIEVETQIKVGSSLLLIHLPSKTFVYDLEASTKLKEPVWHVLTSNLTDYAEYTYRAKYPIYFNGLWWVSDTETSKLGVLSHDINSHWGDNVNWEFSTPIIYNEGFGAIIHELELVCLQGRSSIGVEATVWTSYSTDGEVWSQKKPKLLSDRGHRNKRLVWTRQGHFNNWRVQRFIGTGPAKLSVSRLEARVESLYR